MSGAGTLPSGEEPDGSIGYGSLEDFSLLSGGDFIIQLVNQITFAATGYTNLQDALEKIASQIGFPELAQLLLEAFGGVTGSLLDFMPWFINLTDLFGVDLNMDPNDFNPISVGIAFIKKLLSFLDPTNLGDIPIFGDIIGTITGGGTGLGDLTNFFNAIPFGSILDAITQVIDGIFEAITGSTRGGDLFGDLTDALTHIPFLNILGVGGPATIGGSVTTGWDQLLSGYVGAIGSGASLADLFNIGQAVSSGATLGKFSFDILGIRNNKSLNTGFLPTSQSNIGFDKVALQASAPTFAVTQSTAITAYHRISEASDFGVVSWHGSGVTSITDAFVNIFKMDTTTGENTLVHASSNIVGSLSGSMQQNVYSLPTPIAVVPGDVFGIELAVRGAGTHSVVGQSSWIPDQTVYPRRYSSVRNSGASSPPSTLTPSYGSNVPFIEFGVTASDVPLPHSPDIQQFSVAGSSSYPIPSFANFVDRVVLPAGGGGHQGGTWGIGGAGGDAGTWAWDTLERGVDFVDGDSLTTVVGAGGAAGVGGNGGNGGASTSSITGGSILTTTGGLGATSFDIIGSQHSGDSPGNFSFPGGGTAWLIAGGAAQGTYGAKGNSSGGAGAGGNWISFQPGGAGADGIILYRFRQS